MQRKTIVAAGAALALAALTLPLLGAGQSNWIPQGGGPQAPADGQYAGYVCLMNWGICHPGADDCTQESQINPVTFVREYRCTDSMAPEATW
jgi:hypothetical protein